MHIIIYHLIWCPRRRKPVLTGPVAERCQQLSEGKCTEKGWQALELAVQPDHLHLFARAWPRDRAADVMKACTGSTSLTRRTAFPHLLTLPSLWRRSSFASTAGTVSQETLRRDIAAQTRR